MKRVKTTFWHLSDLHLYEPCATRCPTTADPACHNCIKAVLIERLARALEDDAPDLLLLAGDLFEDDSWQRPDNLLEPLVKAAKRRGTVLVGIRGQHDPPTRDLKSRFPWILGDGETNSSTKVFIRAVPAAERGSTAQERTMRTLRALNSAEPHARKPSILLAHINAAKLERLTPRFRYYALGDMHLSRVVYLDEGAIMATPGHLYSYFDGSGKVWPTFLLKGSITASGHVRVRRVALQGRSLGAPRMRQLYIPHGYRGRAAGELVLVNAPAEILRSVASRSPSLQELKLSGAHEQNVTLRRAVIRYRNRQELRDVVRELLELMPKDVFVGLAKGSGRSEDRWKHYGASILTGALEDFIESCFMSASKTQTSDTEGWMPAT